MTKLEILDEIKLYIEKIETLNLYLEAYEEDIWSDEWAIECNKKKLKDNGADIEGLKRRIKHSTWSIEINKWRIKYGRDDIKFYKEKINQLEQQL